MKKIMINKIGYEHHEEWKNCQDYGFITEGIKCVADGCSEGKHSEIGVKLFCHMLKNGQSVENIFQRLIQMYPDFEDMKNHILFTFLYMTEDEENYYVHSVGDGYIIKESFEGNYSYEKIDYENSPPYYAYNFIEPEYLKKYKEGVAIQERIFNKKEYQTIGLATDGLEYLIKSGLKKEFETLLFERKEFGIKRLINKNYAKCKDDITIVI